MSDVVSPHDRYCKRMFGRLELAAEFLALFLPSELSQQLDLTQLRLSSASYVDPDLREHLSDLVYEAPLKTPTDEAATAVVYVLIEHKSYVDPWAPFQLLQSLMGLWDQQRKAGAKRLALTIPIVLYHGAEPWSAPSELAGLFEPTTSTQLRGLMPSAPHLLVNLRETQLESVQSSLLLKAVLQTLRDVFAPTLVDRLPLILQWLAQHRGDDRLEIIETTLLYLIHGSRLSHSELQQSLEAVTLDNHETIMQTFMQRWIDEGIERGLEQGLSQGIEQGLSQGLSQGLEQGLSQGKQVGEVTGKRNLLAELLQRRLGKLDMDLQTALETLPATLLDQLGIALFDLHTLADLRQWFAEQASQDA